MQMYLCALDKGTNQGSSVTATQPECHMLSCAQLPGRGAFSFLKMESALKHVLLVHMQWKGILIAIQQMYMKVVSLSKSNAGDGWVNWENK